MSKRSYGWDCLKILAAFVHLPILIAAFLVGFITPLTYGAWYYGEHLYAATDRGLYMMGANDKVMVPVPFAEVVNPLTTKE